MRNEVAKVMFLHVSVILSTGGGSALLHAGIPPPHPRTRHPPGADTHPPRADTPLGADNPLGGDTPQEQTPPRSRHPLGADPPGRRPPGRRPPGADTPREQTPPRADTPPPGADTPRDGHCCGWYASYWNAFLLSMCVNIVACEI